MTFFLFKCQKYQLLYLEETLEPLHYKILGILMGDPVTNSQFGQSLNLWRSHVHGLCMSRCARHIQDTGPATPYLNSDPVRLLNCVLVILSVNKKTNNLCSFLFFILYPLSFILLFRFLENNIYTNHISTKHDRSMESS